MDALIAFAVIAVIVAAFLFLAVHKLSSKGRRYKDVLVWAIAVTVVAAGLGAAAIPVGQSEQRAAAQFAEQIQPVAAELERLKLKPVVEGGFYDQGYYRMDGQDSGMVATTNNKGRQIWIAFEVQQNGVAVGCVVDGKVYPTTPAGAIQLTGTTGCDV